MLWVLSAPTSPRGTFLFLLRKQHCQHVLWSHLGFEANVGVVDGWAALATSVVVAAACPGLVSGTGRLRLHVQDVCLLRQGLLIPHVYCLHVSRIPRKLLVDTFQLGRFHVGEGILTLCHWG